MDYNKIYIDFLVSHTKIFKPLTIVCDASDGATGVLINFLKDASIPNLTIIPINTEPNPEFPSHGPNPLEPGATDQISKKIIETKADLGVVLDADGDRAFFIDNKGNPVPSFIIASLLFKYAKGPFVAEELMYKCLQYTGIMKDTSIEIYPSKVGAYFVRQEAKKRGATIGMEYSGHYFWKDFFGADSGLFTTVKLLSLLSGQGFSLGEYTKTIPHHDLESVGLPIEGKNWDDIKKMLEEKFSKENVKLETREGLTVDFGDSWINIRPSNTEPLLRLFAGSQSGAISAALIEKFKSLIV